MTPEEQKQKDLQIRFKTFNERLTSLLAEFKLGINAKSLFTTDGRIVARLEVFDNIEKPKEESIKPQQEDSTPQVEKEQSSGLVKE